MFGYVKAYKPMLRVCELEAYKGAYCGLCKELGKRFGLWARFTLSYDFTFLAVLAMSLSQDEPDITPCRCTFNPLHRTNCCHSNDSLAFAADVAILMLWHKVEDNIADGGLWERAGARVMRAVLRGQYRKVAEQYPELAAVFGKAMAEQGVLEQEKCTELDRICHPSGEMLASVLESLSHDSAERRVLYRLGYLMGRYVYLSDALDDLEQDEQDGSYNPLLHSQDSIDEGEDIRKRAVGSLFLTIAEAGNTYELLELQRFAPILENILFMGLRHNVELISLPRAERPRQSKY